jgi:hypothetical protein
MKAVTLSETSFNKLEQYRRTKGLSRTQALEQAVERITSVQMWEQQVTKRSKQALELSKAGSEALAIQAVRDIRNIRRK